MGERRDVTGALPGERPDFGGDAGPFEMCGEEVGEAWFFVERFGEVGFEQRKRPRVGAAEDVDRGSDEELERDHGGDGIARETEHKGVAAATKDGRLARPNRDGVEIEFGTEGLQNGFDEVVFAHGDATRQNQNVLLEAEFDFGAEVVHTIKRVAQENGFAPGQADLRCQGDAVAVANVKGAGLFRNGNDFVAGGKYGDARAARAKQLCGADLRGEGEFREAEAVARPQGEVAGVGFASLLNYVLAWVGCALERNIVRDAVGEFDHDDGVGPYRHRGAGHDLDTRARSEWLGDRVASFDFAHALEGCAFCGNGGADGIAVTSGAVKRRIVAIRADFLGEGIAEGVRKILFRDLPWVGEDVRRGFLDDKLARILEWEHQGVLGQTGYCSAVAQWAPIL